MALETKNKSRKKPSWGKRRKCLIKKDDFPNRRRGNVYLRHANTKAQETKIQGRKKALPEKRNKVVISWNPTEMTDLKQFKELVVAYEMHSPCVR